MIKIIMFLSILLLLSFSKQSHNFTLSNNNSNMELKFEEPNNEYNYTVSIEGENLNVKGDKPLKITSLIIETTKDKKLYNNMLRDGNEFEPFAFMFVENQYLLDYDSDGNRELKISYYNAFHDRLNYLFIDAKLITYTGLHIKENGKIINSEQFYNELPENVRSSLIASKEYEKIYKYINVGVDD